MSKKQQKPAAAEPAKKKKPEKTVAANTALALIVSCDKFAKLLLMCAPKFPDGSEGAEIVETARRIRPQLKTLAATLATDKEGGAK